MHWHQANLRMSDSLEISLEGAELSPGLSVQKLTLLATRPTAPPSSYPHNPSCQLSWPHKISLALLSIRMYPWTYNIRLMCIIDTMNHHTKLNPCLPIQRRLIIKLFFVTVQVVKKLIESFLTRHLFICSFLELVWSKSLHLAFNGSFLQLKRSFSLLDRRKFFDLCAWLSLID